MMANEMEQQMEEATGLPRGVSGEGGGGVPGSGERGLGQTRVREAGRSCGSAMSVRRPPSTSVLPAAAGLILSP
jgi:hypothetical protein